MGNFSNSDEVFAMSLHLEFPWSIEKAEFNLDSKEVHIYINSLGDAQYPCPVCGKLCPRYDYEDQERVWRHGDVVFFPSYVHCKRPRTKCPDHGVKVVEAPWARAKSRFTLLFESFCMLLLKAMAVEPARKILKISHTALSNILNYWVSKANQEDNLSEVKSICVDETSFKKGHSYVSVIIDTETKRVIDVEEGRSAESLKNFALKLEEKGGNPQNIEYFVSDMSPAYLKAKERFFPKAKGIIDKFHVKQIMLKALEKVRQEEQGKAFSRSKFAGKKLLMIPLTKQSAKQKEAVRSLSKQYPKTGRAFMMVQALDTMYQCFNPKEAQETLNKLISWLKRSRLAPMKEVANTLEKHKESILAYFINRLTNAISEGINSLIQAAKRKARGFRTIKGFTNMIYLIAGKLKLSCPPLFE